MDEQKTAEVFLKDSSTLCARVPGVGVSVLIDGKQAEWATLLQAEVLSLLKEVPVTGDISYENLRRLPLFIEGRVAEPTRGAGGRYVVPAETYTLKERILQHMRDNNHPTNAKNVAKVLGVPARQAANALAYLHREGKVQPDKRRPLCPLGKIQYSLKETPCP